MTRTHNMKRHAAELRAVHAEYNRRTAVLEAHYTLVLRLLNDPSSNAGPADFEHAKSVHEIHLDRAEEAWLRAWYELGELGNPLADVLARQRGQAA